MIVCMIVCLIVCLTDSPQAPHVGGGGAVSGPDHLRCHELQCPVLAAALLVRSAQLLRQAEVNYPEKDLAECCGELRW